MIKVTTTQARAIAKKIQEQVYERDNRKEQELTEEILNSQEYVDRYNGLMDIAESLKSFANKYDVDDTSYGFCMFGSSYYYLHNSESVEEYVTGVMKMYVRREVNKRFNHHYISIDDLVQDIIFESIQSDDISALIENFVNKYND